MALKTLMLRKKIDEKKKALEAHRAKDAEFEAREAELERSIDEASTDEEKETVEAAINDFETERAEHNDTGINLEKELADLENELRNEEKADEQREQTVIQQGNKDEQRKENIIMDTRNIFSRMSVQERDAIFMREDVKGWISEIREHIAQKRDLTNVGLTIPNVFMGYLRQNVERYSKLYKHVNVQRIGGKGREVIMGSVPEAIWTECCANLNELSLGFNDVEVDCYKVGGYFKVCNATLEDSDIALASLLLDAIGQAIGLALDKAILYGRNTATNYKMPLGVVSRLVQTEVPSDYPATARPWRDLHEINITTISDASTGINLFKQLVLAAGAMKGKYARGEKVWIMNETTYTALQVEAMSINASGAIVSGMSGTMPVIGGIVETLEFIPDNVIIGGYFELYTLAERAGQKFAQSEHAFFLQDQTVFKGTARYDGVPVIAEAFVAIGIGGVTPNSNMSFAPDDANDIPLASPSVVAISGSEEIWGHTISDLQSDITVDGNYIKGTLKYVSEGALPAQWGPGYFIALEVTNIDSRATVVKAGMSPSVSSGLLPLDPDHKIIAKVTNKNDQVFKVVSMDGTNVTTDTYFLGSLVLEPVGA